MFHFHKVAYVHYLGEVNMFFMCVQIFFLLTAVQKLQRSNKFLQSYDHKRTATFFLWNTVY